LEARDVILNALKNNQNHMSVWRQKAIACLPEFKEDLEQPDSTIYDVFLDLLPTVVSAHKENNVARLSLMYEFAEWCFRQEEKELWNAAGVGFYEHLGDYTETSESMTQWVKFDIYKEIRGLLKLRISEKKLHELDKKYSYTN
jgi:hypothetical protein